MSFHLIEMQQRSQWCWAAVAFNVDHYFSRNSTSTQCSIVREVLNLSRCCNDPVTYEGCDVAEYLHKALGVVQRPYTPIARPLSFEEVQNEIDAHRPICVAISWRGGGGHFVIIAGYRVLKTKRQELYVLDPRHEEGLLSYDEFRFIYRRAGQWTFTYLMR